MPCEHVHDNSASAVAAAAAQFSLDAPEAIAAMRNAQAEANARKV